MDDMPDDVIAARERAAVEMSRLTRLRMRNAAMRRGYSRATASAMADIFEQMLIEHMTGQMASPLHGIKG